MVCRPASCPTEIPDFYLTFEEVFKTLGTQLKFSTVYHLQTDGKSKRTIQILKDMLIICMLDFKESWEDHPHLADFAYNNSYQFSIKMTPFEALYGRKCMSPLCWDDISERRLLGSEVIQQTMAKVKIIRKRLKVAQDRKKRWADLDRRLLEFEVGDFIFLKISPTKRVIRFGSREKLSPRFILSL